MSFDYFYLFSWDYEARNQLFKIFNYDESDPKILYRRMLKLEELNFEDFDLSSVCDEDSSGPFNLSAYCLQLENVPDLDTTMHLMKLAKFPLDIDDSLKRRFTNFSV